MGTVQMELLTTREFVAAGFTAAIIPLGACESHGDHMPMGTDGFTAHARRAFSGWPRACASPSSWSAPSSCRPASTA